MVISMVIEQGGVGTLWGFWDEARDERKPSELRGLCVRKRRVGT